MRYIYRWYFVCYHLVLLFYIQIRLYFQEPALSLWRGMQLQTSHYVSTWASYSAIRGLGLVCCDYLDVILYLKIEGI